MSLFKASNCAKSRSLRNENFLMTSRIYFLLSTFKEFCKLRFMHTALEKYIFILFFHFFYLFSQMKHDNNLLVVLLFIARAEFLAPVFPTFLIILAHKRQSASVNWIFSRTYFSISEFTFNLSIQSSSVLRNRKYLS